MIRRVLAVLVCITIGMSIGGVLHARDGLREVRTCEEINEYYMECDDGTACTRIDGMWVCTDNVPAAVS